MPSKGCASWSKREMIATWMRMVAGELGDMDKFETTSDKFIILGLRGQRKFLNGCGK